MTHGSSLSVNEPDSHEPVSASASGEPDADAAPFAAGALTDSALPVLPVLLSGSVLPSHAASSSTAPKDSAASFRPAVVAVLFFIVRLQGFPPCVPPARVPAPAWLLRS